ncbi:MAG: hypothetical protein AAGI51_05955 [Pseudomonadota bacterium]
MNALAVSGWYEVGMRDFHLAWCGEQPAGSVVSVVRVCSDRPRAQIEAEHRRFGVERVHVLRARGAAMRQLTKFLPILLIWTLILRARYGAERIRVTYDGFGFWATPPWIARRRVEHFVHDPEPHESGANPLWLGVYRRYSDWLLFRRRWRALVVGAEAYAAPVEAKCAGRSPVRHDRFPRFDRRLFDRGAAPEGLPRRPYVLFFGRVDRYKGVAEWLADWPFDAPGAPPVVVAGAVLDERVRRFSDRATLLDRFVAPEEAPALFDGAAAVALPYRSVTHSGVVDIARSFGKPVYVSDLPFFEERYRDDPQVRPMAALVRDLIPAAGPTAAARGPGG